MEASGWQLESALELFFSNDHTVAPPVSNYNSSFDDPPQRGGRLGVMDEVDDVRQPMEQQVSRLFGDEEDMMMPTNPGAMQQQRATGFSSLIPSFLTENLGFLRGRPTTQPQVASPQAELTKGSDQFRKMFAAPKKLLFNGQFQDAQNEALEKGKWLLVNIQQDDVFDCHRLNRDTWNNELVSMLIEVSFVFWQVDQASAEGNRFKSLYHCDDYPYIAIIDPRTGENVKHWTGFVGHVKMSDELQNFTDLNSLDDGYIPPPAQVPPQPVQEQPKESLYPIPSSSAQPAPINVPEDEDEALQRALQESLSAVGGDTSHMSEDDLLQAAINASLQESNVPAPSSSSNVEVEPIEEDQPIEEEKPQKSTPDVNFLDQTDKYMAGDSTEAALSTRLQLRLPSGKREVIKMLKQTPLVVVYALIRKKLAVETETDPLSVPPFTVVAVNKQLENVEDKTLIDANALGADRKSVV